MIESDVMASIYAQAAQGASKESCALVTDEETGAFWDQVAGEIGELGGKGYTFEVPSDPSGSVVDYGGNTIEQMKAFQADYAAGVKPTEEPAEAPDPAEDPDGDDDAAAAEDTEADDDE